MPKKTNVRSATQEDVSLGSRIRTFRNAAKMSQADLGAALTPPVSFQQVQKYEKGLNRVSHTKLAQICKVLGCSIGDMIADMKGEGQTNVQAGQMIQLMGDHATFRLVKAFHTLPREMQFRIVSLVECVQHGLPS